MAQYMTTVALELTLGHGAVDRMIASSVDLIDHLAQMVQGLDESNSFSGVTELGPLRIHLTLHGRINKPDFFDALPLVQTASSEEKPHSTRRVDFVINIIDGTCCGVKRPRLKWCVRDFGYKRRVPGWSDSERTTYFLRSECGVAVADWRSNRAYMWIPSIEAATTHERAAPFRWILDGLAQRHGLMTLHAAAIGEGGIGVLIVGEGGRGKSILALAAVGAGMDYLADDYCLVDALPPYRAYRLFNTAKVRPDGKIQLNWIAGLEHDLEPGAGGKRIFNLTRHAPARLADWFEIRALLLPDFTDESFPVLERASPHDAFRRMAPSTVAQCEGTEAQAVADVGRLARTLPSYRIRMPPEPRRSIEQIRDLIRVLRQSPKNA
jgi:hypothetical protein